MKRSKATKRASEQNTREKNTERLQRRRVRRADDDSGAPTGRAPRDVPTKQRSDEPKPKLTPAQRTRLITLIGKYHDTSVVRQVLQTEEPDFPEVSPSLIRYYRRKATATQVKLMEAERDKTLKEGLADKRVRIANLQHTYAMQRWRLGELYRILDIANRKQINDFSTLALIRAICELETAANRTLDQIRHEVSPAKDVPQRDRLLPSRDGAGMEGSLPALPEPYDREEAIDKLSEMIAELLQDDADSEEAWRRAQGDDAGESTPEQA